MWEIDLKAQIFTFLFSLLFGGAFCLIYDVFRLIERSRTKLITAVIDIIYFVLISFANFCFLLAASNGEMRLYLILGEIMGFFICKKTVSRIFYLLLVLVTKCIKKVFFTMKKLICAPISDFFAKIADFCLKIGKKSLNIIKKRLKKHKDIVYTKEKCLNVGKGKETANEN